MGGMGLSYGAMHENRPDLGVHRRWPAVAARRAVMTIEASVQARSRRFTNSGVEAAPCFFISRAR